MIAYYYFLLTYLLVITSKWQIINVAMKRIDDTNLQTFKLNYCHYHYLS